MRRTPIIIGSFCASATRDGSAPDPAPPPPTITSLHCESIDVSFTCDVARAGGTAPVEVRWFVNGNRINALTNMLSVTRTCTEGNTVQVRVTVVDAANRSAERSQSSRCIGSGF